jgi:integrase
VTENPGNQAADAAEVTTAKAPRRANGDGSVFFWPGRGWYAAVSTADGRRIQRKAPKQTERGAEALLRKLVADRQSGELTRLSTTLEQFLEEWLRVAKRRGVKPRSLDAYRDSLTTHVLPTLGKKRLDRITATDLDRLYEARADAGLSATTIASVHTRLTSLLRLAKRRKLVGHIVTELVDPPKIQKYDARTLTVEEARHLLQGIADHRHGPLWTFILGTGCRFGEAAGLRWQDLAPDADIAHVRQKVNRRREGKHVRLVIEDGAKTDAGQRDLHLPAWVSAALEHQRAVVDLAQDVAGDRWVDQDLVFPNRHGGPLRESHVIVQWHKALEVLGLEGKPGQPPLRIHDLRHSKGTLMADEGEDLVVIQKTLGHARASTTADLYVGRVPKALRQAAERYGALLDPPVPAPPATDQSASEAVS